MTYPLSFRQHVFAHKEKKCLTFEQTSALFDVPVRTLFRWQQQPEPCTHRNKPATKMDRQALADDVNQYPDAYLAERVQRFGVTKNVFWQAIRRLNVSRKKTLHHPKIAERQRREFQHATQRYRRPIVYIDESGFANDMPGTPGDLS